MSIVMWYEQGRVIYVRHPAVVNNHTVIAWNQAAVKLLDQYLNTKNTIHIIIDATYVQDYGVVVQQLVAHADVQRLSQHPRFGWGIYLGNTDNVVYKFTATVAGQRLGENIKFFATEADAVRFLKQRDAALLTLRVKGLSGAAL